MDSSLMPSARCEINPSCWIALVKPATRSTFCVAMATAAVECRMDSYEMGMLDDDGVANASWEAW